MSDENEKLRDLLWCMREEADKGPLRLMLDSINSAELADLADHVWQVRKELKQRTLPDYAAIDALGRVNDTLHSLRMARQ